MTEPPKSPKPPAPLVSVAGPSNSGKTTLVSRLIALFAQKGKRVAAIKHARHGFSMDRPGKDTFVHKAAGAYAVMAVSETGLALVRDISGEPSPRDLAALYFTDADLVLVEGYKAAAIPRIVVGRSPADFDAFWDDPNVFALVGPAGPSALPRFDPDSVSDIAGLITRRFLKEG